VVRGYAYFSIILWVETIEYSVYFIFHFKFKI
jgi:hypothetical protein